MKPFVNDYYLLSFNGRMENGQINSKTNIIDGRKDQQ